MDAIADCRPAADEPSHCWLAAIDGRFFSPFFGRLLAGD
jgi:hypothetical protein